MIFVALIYYNYGATEGRELFENSIRRFDVIKLDLPLQ